MRYGQTLSIIEHYDPAGPTSAYPAVAPLSSAYMTIEIDEGLNGRSTAEGWVFGDLAIYINDTKLHVLVHLPTKVEIFETNSCSIAWVVKLTLIRIGADLQRMVDDREYARYVIRILADFLDVDIIHGFLL